MRAFKMFQADAFADRLFAGNPAAVLVLDAPLPEALMQAIAAENNLSETAFVVRTGEGLAIRWFTPTHEAAFCGHATLAAAHILMTEYGQKGPVELTTRKVGTLRVTEIDGDYQLDLPRYDAMPVGTAPEALAALFPDGCVAVLKTFENYVVVLKDAATVRDHAPDTALMKRLGDAGIAITAAGGVDHTGAPADFTSRYFAPAHGIDEDPVTGSAHATLAPYWAGVLGRTELTAFQASSRGGRIGCRVTKDRVYLTGQARTYLRGTISLPV
jgi:PhzF family phenazine biosynthesis protein